MTFLFNQALQAHQSGKISEAEALYRKIISADPGHFDAFHMLGILCSGNGKNQDADKFYRAALSIDPRFPPCHLNYGFFLLEQRRPDAAIASFDQALALFPKFAEAYLGRGNALRELKRYADAIQAYNQALALKPNLAEAHAGIGNMLARLERHDEAITAYGKAIALKPDLEFIAGELIRCKMRLCDWNNLSSDYQRLLAPAKGERIDSQPFDLLSAPSSAREQLACAKFWISKKHPASATPIWQGEIYKHDRIRVAYVSSDFRPHPVSYLIAGLIEGHDRARFSVTGISLQPEDSSEIGRRMKRAFDNFIDASAMTDQKISQLIHELEIDIAIDLNGFTRDARTNIFAWRPAPIQVNYLGYPGTMGAPYIDYIIADQTVLPIHQQEFYSEKIVYMPGSFQANDRERSISERIYTRAELGLPPDGFVLCCFNNSYKINPDVFDIWMRILKQVNHSVLWLVASDKAVEDNLRKEAAARSINGERLIFAPRIPYAEHLARLSSANLFLDTAPFNAGTTASDALWVGLPVLTRTCGAFSGRMAASLLAAINLPELITSSPEAYEALAIDLATSSEKLAVIKQKLSQNRLTTPLFDTRLFTRHIETAYTAMFERYQAGLPPENIQAAK